jgi:thiol-disulfide isomerase/thioredoxin
MKHVLLTILMSLTAWQAYAITGYNGSPSDLQTSIDAKENVLLIFGASWCGPCQRMKRDVWSKTDFIKFTDDNKVTRFYIDIDQNRPTAQEYGVTSIPTWFVLSDGKIQKKSGYVSKSQAQNTILNNIKDLTPPPPPVFTPFSKDIASLNESIQTGENVLLVFGATWCGACKEMTKEVWEQEEFLAVAKELKVKKFYVDIDEQPELAEKFEVTSTPSFFVIKESNIGEAVGQQTLDQVNTLLSETFKFQPPAKPYSDSEELLTTLTNEKADFIVIFGATWCGPCQKMKKDVWSVQDFIDFSNNLGITRFYFDTDQFGSLTSAWGVTAIPSWFVVRDGEVVSKNSSSSKEEVEQILANAF